MLNVDYFPVPLALGLDIASMYSFIFAVANCPPTSYCTTCLSGSTTATECGASSATAGWAEWFCNKFPENTGSLVWEVTARAINWFCSNCLDSPGSLLGPASAISGCASSFCCSCSCSFHCSLSFGSLRCTDRRAFLLADSALLLLALTGYHCPSTGECLLPSCQHLNLQARTEIRQKNRPDDMTAFGRSNAICNCTDSLVVYPKGNQTATGIHSSLVLHSRATAGHRHRCRSTSDEVMLMIILQLMCDVAVHLLRGASFKLTMLHKVVPKARSIPKGQRVFGSVQLEIEAI